VASRLCGLVANPALALSWYADKLHERLKGLYAPSRQQQCQEKCTQNNGPRKKMEFEKYCTKEIGLNCRRHTGRKTT
jgi:hypothetical protein